MTKGTGRYADDPRVDRFVHWALAGCVVLGLGWFQTTVSTLATTVGELKTAVAILGVSQKRVDDHESRLRVLESK